MRRTAKLSACLAAVAASAVALGASATAGAPPTASDLSRHPVVEDSAWKAYVVGTSDVLQYPTKVRVVGAQPGQVVNPGALKAADGKAMTITASAAGSPHLELDLGADTGGFVEVGTTRTDGTTVHLAYSEAHSLLSANGDAGQYPVTSQTGVPFITDVSLGTDDNPTARFDDVSAAGSYKSPAVRGAQRWIWLQLNTPGTVSIDYVRVRRTHFLPGVNDYAGHFLSSDVIANRAWYASAYTLAVDSIPRPDGKLVAVDGAKRDRLLWIGDLVPQSLAALTAFPQGADIIKRSLQAFSCQQGTEGLLASNSQLDRTCPDTPPAPTSGTGITLNEYTASWVIALHDYVRLTGDRDFGRRMLPVARRAMGYFTGNLDSKGLYTTPANSQNWHPFDPAAGEDAHTNATIHRALNDLAEVEDSLGAATGARTLRRQADALAAAMRAHLWDPGAGAFLLNSTDPLPNHTQDAQVESVYGGVVTGSQARAALSFITKHLTQTYGVKNGEYDEDPFMENYVSPFISSTELLARLHVGDTAGALSLLRREWGHMVTTDPYTVVWEKVAFDGGIAPYITQEGLGAPGSDKIRGPSSYAHGWATGPVPALNQYILGIRPATDGYASWTVAPQPGDLRWAQGQSHAPGAPVLSRWVRGTGDRSFVLTAGSSSGTGSVSVPLLGESRRIAMDGRVVWDGARVMNGAAARRVGDAIEFMAVRGVHTWAWAAEAHDR